MPRPTESMLTFFGQKLTATGKPFSQSTEFVHTWRLANHSEESLFSLIKRNQPDNQTQLRLMLVKELAKASAASLPVNVKISELLDFTVEYFMPEDRVNIMDAKIKSNPSTTQTAPVINEKTYEKLNKLSNMLDMEAGAPFSPDRQVFDHRMKTMEPLRAFIEERMKRLASRFSISEDYIIQMALTIVKVLATKGFSLDIMKKHVMIYGYTSLGELINAKSRTYETHFPPGISPKFIVTFVLDYLEDK